MNTPARRLLPFALAALSLPLAASCKAPLGELDDALKADPQRSPCQAYCGWASSCNAQTPGREGEGEALTARCLEATRAQNGSCVEMESEGISAATSELYASCVRAIDAEAAGADACLPFTGSALEVNAATPPADCAAVAYEDRDTFNVARVATAEANDALCARVSETLCARATSCLVSEFGVPEEALAALTPAPLDRCLGALEGGVTSSCVMDELYALDGGLPEGEADAAASPEGGAPPVLFSVNPNREAARACLAALAALPCADLFSGALPPECAGAFSDPAAAGGALRGFGCGLERPELEAACGA